MSRRFALIVVGILVGVCVTAIGASGIAHAGGCPNVQRYAVGGNGDPQSRGVPHVPWPYNPVAYSADVFHGDASRFQARDELNSMAHSVRAACPGTRIEVYGYSLGASAASLAVDWWQSDRRMNYNTIAVLYGDPRRPPANGFGGVETTGLPNIPFGTYTWFGGHRWGPIPVTDVCHLGHDIVCDAPVPIQSNLPEAWGALNGYLNNGHRY